MIHTKKILHGLDKEPYRVYSYIDVIVPNLSIGYNFHYKSSVLKYNRSKPNGAWS